MLKKALFAGIAAFAAVTPATAQGLYSAEYTYWRHWHPYPNYAAAIPYGLPVVAYMRTTTYLPPFGIVPAKLYFIPQTTPFYNVPPYMVVAPF